MIDATDLPATRICPCGSELWKVLVTFSDEYEIETYSTDGFCAACGLHARVPTPLDLEAQ